MANTTYLCPPGVPMSGCQSFALTRPLGGNPPRDGLGVSAELTEHQTTSLSDAMEFVVRP